jgi:quinohemoprotein ethanol dehydrogenase
MRRTGAGRSDGRRTHGSGTGALLSALMLAGLAACTEAKAPPITAGDVNASAITDADKRPEIWISHGRTYSEQRFSPLSQINLDTVKDVGIAWSAQLDTSRGMEATPIVVDGVMYLTSAWSVVYAYDAVSGERLWKFDPKVEKARGVSACCDVVNRGVAIWEGMIYVGTIDGRLIALDASRDKGVTTQASEKIKAPVWETVTVDQSKPYTITGAPRVVKGKVIIGNGGAEYGVRGYVSAYDAKTGELAWRFYTTPNPKKEPDGAASDRVFADKANASWGDSGEWTETGGGGTAWDAMAYDPDLDILYVGIGNGSPWNRERRDPSGGDNLFLSSILALKPDTGEYVWHYQTTPGDSWDYTATQHIILADIKIGDRVRKVAMQAPKNGFFYVLDRETGELISADKYQSDVNWASHVDLATGRPVETPGVRYLESPFMSIPGPLGSHNWHPMSFSPDTGLVYIPAQTLPQIFADQADFAYRPGFWNTGVEFAAAPGPTPTLNERLAARAALKGQLVAWDPVAKAPRWVVDYPHPWNGGVLSTAGGLVFQGGLDGKFRAYDAAKGGAAVWEIDAQYPVLSGPISYEINGEQYIAVTAGWGTALPVTGGGNPLPRIGSPELGRVLVFKIGGKVELEPYEVFEVDRIPATEDFGSAAQVEYGRVLYDRNCQVCHGGLVVSSGVIQDLRWAQTPGVRQDFAEVVLGGKYASAGMASFAAVLNETDAEAIRAYIINRASEDAAAYAAQSPSP